MTPVIAGLPPRDQLQAVLDRGETPSPEMAAAAGAARYLTPAPAIAALAVLLALLALLAGVAVLSSRTTLHGVAPVSLSPGSLAQKVTIATSAGS